MPQNVFVGPRAEFYDAGSTDMFDPAVLGPTVAFLAELADRAELVGSGVGSGSALEFAIGTGRVGLPLSQAGVEVHGIDISADMLAQLAAKDGAEAMKVTVGDFATTKLGRHFGLVYLVFNTITNVLTTDEQVETFCNAADHLVPGGCFVIEVHVPELRRLPPGENVRAFTVTDQHLGFDEFDFVSQRLVSHHYWKTDGRLSTFESHHRYVWPAELDLMARIAGMSLRERWSSWAREPFTSESASHVSVWEKPEPS